MKYWTPIMKCNKAYIHLYEDYIFLLYQKVREHEDWDDGHFVFFETTSLNKWIIKYVHASSYIIAEINIYDENAPIIIDDVKFEIEDPNAVTAAIDYFYKLKSEQEAMDEGN